MQQAEKTAPETEPESQRGLGLIAEGRIVEPQLSQSIPKILKLAGVHRIETAENHRFHFAVPREGSRGRTVRLRDGIPDFCIVDGLDAADDKTDFPCGQI